MINHRANFCAKFLAHALYDRVFCRAAARAGAIAWTHYGRGSICCRGTPLTTFTFAGRPIAALAAALASRFGSALIIRSMTACRLRNANDKFISLQRHTAAFQRRSQHSCVRLSPTPPHMAHNLPWIFGRSGIFCCLRLFHRDCGSSCRRLCLYCCRRRCDISGSKLRPLRARSASNGDTGFCCLGAALNPGVAVDDAAYRRRPRRRCPLCFRWSSGSLRRPG